MCGLGSQYARSFAFIFWVIIRFIEINYDLQKKFLTKKQYPHLGIYGHDADLATKKNICLSLRLEMFNFPLWNLAISSDVLPKFSPMAMFVFINESL